jgi:hypothetical protein
MLAEHGRRSVDGAGRVRHFNRHAGHADRPRFGLLQTDDHLACERLRMFADFLHRLNAAARLDPVHGDGAIADIERDSPITTSKDPGPRPRGHRFIGQR